MESGGFLAEILASRRFFGGCRLRIEARQIWPLPENIFTILFIAGCLILGYNLFCFTNYEGYDPEVDTSSKKNAMCPGIDYAAYPKSRTFVGGINITF